MDQLLSSWGDLDVMEVTKRLLDLFLVSVLLDAGAGSKWKYYVVSEDKAYNRSEGLGIASLEMFKSGLFSSDPNQPHRVDAAALKRLTAESVGKSMQVSNSNPMDGLEGRTGVLIRLGDALEKRDDFFGSEGRPGNMLGKAYCNVEEEHVKLIFAHRLFIKPSNYEKDRYHDPFAPRLLGSPHGWPGTHLATVTHSNERPLSGRRMASRSVGSERPELRIR